MNEVIITAELSRRPSRASNPAAENEALHRVALAITGDPQESLDALVGAALMLCNAGAAGVSLLDTSGGGPGEFRWVALAGSYASFISNTTPGDHSPCGTCLDRGSPQLYYHPARFFKYLDIADPPIVEGLVVPFRAGETVGTIWVISHQDTKQFTSEDVRVLTSLAKFTGATLAAQYSSAMLRARTEQLEQSQKALLDNRHFSDQVLESTGDCIKVLDLEGRLLSMNAPGLKLMEVDDFASCQNSIWTEFWDGASAESARSAFAAASAGTIGSFEGPCCTLKGTPKWWHVLVTPIFGADGKPEKLLVVSRDVTGRRDAEQKIKDSYELAAAANRNKDLFLAALSHELRTPLSPVLLAITAMQTDQSLSAEVHRYLEMIRRNVEVEVRLIDDLLDVNRAVNGKLRLDTECAGIHRLLKFATETCDSDITQKKISLDLKLESKQDMVTVDSARMQQVFWNLLKNAIKFSGEKQKIEISTSNPGPNTIEIQFKDYGVGISQEVLPRLFTAFEQGESDTTQRFGGLGMGLAIAKAVVELHGGTIHAHSEGRDRGASFIVRLPLSETDAALIAPDKLSDAPSANGKVRVLVVEDHADTANVLQILLRVAGYQVKTAGSASAALGAMAAEPFDVVVSDVGLPDATGYELMREIREKYNMKGIAMTGYGMEEDFAKSREAGFVAHVVKPINMEQLDRVIRHITCVETPAKSATP